MNMQSSSRVPIIVSIPRHSGEKVEQLTLTNLNERRLRTTSTFIFNESCLRHP